MKIQKLAFSDYAKQFKSQPYSVLNIAAALTIEDMAYQLNDREEAVCVALLCFRLMSYGRTATKEFCDVFNRYDIDYGTINLIGNIYASADVLREVIKSSKYNTRVAGFVFDLLLCFKYMLNSNEDLFLSMSLDGHIHKGDSIQLRKAAIIYNAI